MRMIRGRDNCLLSVLTPRKAVVCVSKQGPGFISLALVPDVKIIICNTHFGFQCPKEKYLYLNNIKYLLVPYYLPRHKKYNAFGTARNIHTRKHANVSLCLHMISRKMAIRILNEN